MNTLNKEIHVDETVDVNIGVSNPDAATFAAGEVKVQFDTDKLTFNRDESVIGNATVKEENGIITLEDYGENKNFGTGVYTLKFTAKADGNAAITLLSAAFVNKENAAKSDLIAATLNPNGEKVIINNGNNMDVNGTGILDASDAQLVYNMYNAVYNEFTSDVTMEKFLRADANGDNKVDVKDAEVIINKILSGKAN